MSNVIVLSLYSMTIFEEWNRCWVKCSLCTTSKSPGLSFAPATIKGIAFTKNLQTKTGSMSRKAKHCLGVCLMLMGRYLESCPTFTFRSDPAINFVRISLKRWRRRKNKSFPFPFLAACSKTHFINFSEISYGRDTIYCSG